jgi:hypothetical protein
MVAENVVMVYAPRNEDEIDTVYNIVLLVGKEYQTLVAFNSQPR